MKRLSLILGAALWVIAPAVALVLLWQQAGAVTLVEEKSTWVPVSQAPAALTEPAEVAVSWKTLPPVLAPSWEGAVQEVLVSPGEHLGDGTPVALIENIVREAWVTKTPFFRPIEQGDAGVDVAELNKKLKARGLSHGDGDKATLATAQGVEKLAQELGAGKTRVFDPSWVVFLNEPGIISEVDLTVGAQPPGLGQNLISFEPQPAQLTLVRQDSVAIPETPNADFGNEGPAVSHELNISEDQLFALDGSDSVLFGSVSLSVDLESRQLSKESSAELLELITPSDHIVPVTVSTPIDAGAVAVPLGALVHDANGSCVVIRDADTHQVVPVTEVTTGAGKSVIVGQISASDSVRVPPGDRPSCS